MGPRNSVEGRIYSFRSEAECAGLGVVFPDIPSIVLCHRVLVLDWIPQRKGYVKVMTITSKLRPDGEYLPISPTKKKPFPIQLRLQNGPESIVHNMRIINITALRLFSYLKIDSYYEVPLRILREEKDRFGCQLMLCPKHLGSIRHLRSYLKDHEKCQMQRNDEDVVSDGKEF
ncbi:hypothetical protein P152DRAFT_153203 [Eremomyces bilateralis CBS 781.70]|uniref:Uncharacterized protein n=1 Tax=Eremomyces bilateralis CBS 781.70 TaxID=1392243 RepID=A0A6G1FUT8_9PEZI|nr:uncharacterized protein P152DRAFT_153203 [Eremomyces bilateralis CBS 781.70]KAF1809577.1 hypothetical protein P152DRAFT_153203 [Eremomyces bilateralis CBS 781.70]